MRILNWKESRPSNILLTEDNIKDMGGGGNKKNPKDVGNYILGKV